MSDLVLWRCRRCGKWSHAKRRPAAHQAVKVLEGKPGSDYRKDVMVHCGPFDRYVATHDDPDPAPDNPDYFGRHVHGTEREWHAHFTSADAGVPW